MQIKPFKKLMSFKDAYEICMKNAKPVLRKEKLAIEIACGRVAAENLYSPIDLPPFRRSAMDGYAVRASATFGATRLQPKILKSAGTLFAGELPEKEIKKDECIRIATGARMPASADAVVLAEDTEAIAGMVKVYSAVAPGENVSQQGVDVKKGNRIVKTGEVLSPAKIGLLAGAGITTVRVYEKPVVSIISTGDEIAPLGRPLPEGKVYDSNAYTIASIVAQNGGVPVREGIIPDFTKDIEKVVERSLAKADLVVVSGGSSVGTKDILVDAVQKFGTLLFHGVLIKPGKPLLCAKIRRKLLFGIPGYPTSCFMATYIFVADVVRKMAHLSPRKAVVVKAKLASSYHKKSGRREFLPVKLIRKANVDYAVSVYKETGALTSVADADGYIEISEDVELVEKNEYVTVKLFQFGK